MNDGPAPLSPRRLLKVFLTGLAVLLAMALAAAGFLHLQLQQVTVAGAALLVVLATLLAVAARYAFAAQAGRVETPAHPFLESRSPAGLGSNGTVGGSPQMAATPINFRRWSLDVFAAIDAQRFAAVCETWFSWAGFDTRSQAHRTNEGVDIWLHAARMPGPVAIVRCKHWLNKPVGLQEMKEFSGLVDTYQSAHGTYTTTSTYTPEALQFAREHGIDAVDGRGLLRRIQTRTRQRQQALLAVAYNGQV